MDYEEETGKADREVLQVFHMLYERYEKTVLKYLYVLVNGSSLKGHIEPEDLSQETWENVWNALQANQLNNETHAKRWLHTVARNVFIDNLRKFVGKAGWGSIDDPSVIRIADPDADISIEVDSEELKRILNDAIQSLPREHREPLALHEFEGLSYKEIAESLMLKIGTVKSRIHYAKKMLKEAMQYYEY